MTGAASRFDRPALAVVVRIARRQLRMAAAAAERLHDGGDAEALHAFRVAIRRLRSTLQAYRSQLRGVVRPKDRRRLRRLAEATGPARDAEVQIGRLRELRRELDGDPRVLASRVLRRLRRRMQEGYAQARVEVEAVYPRTARALDKRLRRAVISPDALPSHIVVGRLVAVHTDRLRPLLEALPALAERRQLHQARIETKRLRYVLEPVQRHLPASTLLMHRLEALQDLLGELHDFQVLEQTLAAGVPGRSSSPLPALTRLVRERQRRVYAEVQRSFAAPHAASVLGSLDLLVARLGAGRRSTLPAHAPLRAVDRREVVSQRRRW
jgi:CHAD domain-containing protein